MILTVYDHIWNITENLLHNMKILILFHSTETALPSDQNVEAAAYCKLAAFHELSNILDKQDYF